LCSKSFFNIKSLAPRQLNRLPLPKTSLISFLPFKCSSRLKRKEPFPPPAGTAGTLFPLIRLFLVRNRQLDPALCPAAL
jgi:hypothetical protein